MKNQRRIVTVSVKIASFFLLLLCCLSSAHSTFSRTATPSSYKLQGDAPGKPGWKVLYFWSSSCPCVRRCEDATLFPLFHKYQGKGVRFYAVASNAANVAYVPAVPIHPIDPTANVQSTVNTEAEQATLNLPYVLEKAETPPYPILVDGHHKIADSLKATHTPETFLIDPRGHIVFHGDPDDSAEQLVKTGHERIARHYLASALEKALADKKVIVPVSGTFGCEIDRSDVPDTP